MKLYTPKIINIANMGALIKTINKIFVKQIRLKKDSFFGFSGEFIYDLFYQSLVQSFNKEKLNFSHAKFALTSELVDLRKTYLHNLTRARANLNFFTKTNVNLLNTFSPNDSDLKKFDKNVAAPMDILFLLINYDGTIAFNSAKSLPNSLAHTENISPILRKKMLSHFHGKESYVPKKVNTIGMKTILSAKKIVCFVTHTETQPAVDCLLKQRYDKKIPASILVQHPNVELLLDERLKPKVATK